MQSFSTSSPNNSTPSPPAPAPAPDGLASSCSTPKALAAAASFHSSSALPPPGPIPFALPTDAEWLAPPVCLLREQLEVFAATPQDIAEKKSGSKPFLAR
mmetsp:Transcript_13931/g.40061  ORF Transcript_13931/g.40061 Transcript_13931/m.40061 type:complete len:100 (+) Transcript_13931:230-529(+)